MLDAVIDTIVALAGQGLTRAVIAGRVGLSRSAVCGCLWRRRIPAVRLLRKPPAPRPPRPTKRPAVSPGTDRPIEPRSTAVPLVALTDHQCHWPTSADGATTYFFCGSDRGDSWHQSYCPYQALRSVNREPSAHELGRLRVQAQEIAKCVEGLGASIRARAASCAPTPVLPLFAERDASTVGAATSRSPALPPKRVTKPTTTAAPRGAW